MRKFVMLAIASVAAIVATLLSPVTPAQADQVLTLNFGPGGYDVIYAPPSGTLTIGGGGRISAQCTAVGARANPLTFRPTCTTRVVPCPATSAYCSVNMLINEYALLGTAKVNGQAFFTGGFYFNFVVTTPYNCPHATTCGTRVTFDVTPGTNSELVVFNTGSNPFYTSVTANIGEVVH